MSADIGAFHNTAAPPHETHRVPLRSGDEPPRTWAAQGLPTCVRVWWCGRAQGPHGAPAAWAGTQGGARTDAIALAAAALLLAKQPHDVVVVLLLALVGRAQIGFCHC